MQPSGHTRRDGLVRPGPDFFTPMSKFVGNSGIPRGGKEGREPVQPEKMPFWTESAGMCRAAGDARHTEAAFLSRPFALREWRGATIGPGEGLRAVSVVEDDDRVVVEIVVL